jgi:hypothetical protein
MLRNTQVTLATLTHAFALRVFGGDSFDMRSPLQVTPQLQAHVLLAAADDLKSSAAWEAMQTAKAAWIELLLAASRAGWQRVGLGCKNEASDCVVKDVATNAWRFRVVSKVNSAIDMTRFGSR